jgi:AspT/YidE/YbjL antiporter-like protein
VLLKCEKLLGKAIEQPTNDLGLNLNSREAILLNRNFIGKTLAQIQDMYIAGHFRGVSLSGVRRNHQRLGVTGDLKLKLGDILELYGTEEGLDLVCQQIGMSVAKNTKTDLAYFGAGLVLGILLNYLHITVHGLHIHMGAVGVIAAGLVFGWLNSRQEQRAYIPSSTVAFLQDFGLTAFIAILGLSSGKEAIASFMHSGSEIFIAGIIVSLVPFILSYLFARYILNYTNVALLAGALCGARSANPAFGAVLEYAGNSVPSVPFAITYSVSNIILTIIWALVIYLA